jgi:glycine/D-amino acid oxidase-like deaminating enzyme
MNQKADIVVIGSGIGGLCCAGLLAKYGFKVIVCESHSRGLSSIGTKNRVKDLKLLESLS